MTHPEEQLAAYVDGTLDQRGRAEVDAHLAACPTCREEVELAGRARSVLAGLPDVALPPEVVRPSLGMPRRSARDRFGRTAWAAGLAAAASIAAILALIVAGPSGSNRPVAAGAPTPPAEAAQTIHSTADYDSAGIRRLAEQLATRYSRRTHDVLNAAGSATGDTTTATTSSDTAGGSPSAADAPKAPTATPSGAAMGAAGTGTGAATSQSSKRTSPRVCVTRAARLPQETRPIRLIQARYRGTPVYIAAFLADGALPDRIVLWVVSTRTCHAITSVEQPIP